MVRGPAPWALAALVLGMVAGARGAEDMLELAEPTWAEQLNALPQDRWVLMEFYAHWCPVCQRFQPEYERVATFFAGRGKAEPVVTVARLDCADHAALCGVFEIRGYPTLRVGTASDFAAKAPLKTPVLQPATRTLEGIVAGLQLRLKANITAAPALDVASPASPVQPQEHLQVLRQAPGHMDLEDAEGASVKSWEYMVGMKALLSGVEARQALRDWVDLLARSHPVKKCKQGAQAIGEQLEELWPAGDEMPQPELLRMEMCPGTTLHEWGACKGSAPDKRGYTCGLWTLLHALASRLPDEANAGAVYIATVKGFIGSFFQCTECAQHFVKHASTEEAASVSSKRDVVLWLWRTHNVVNRRLSVEADESGHRDPESPPHVQWPGPQHCPACLKAAAAADGETQWDEDGVYAFLQLFYSGEHPAATQLGRRLRAKRARRNGRAGWALALAIVAAVCGVVYLALRHSGSYALRKSNSRQL